MLAMLHRRFRIECRPKPVPPLEHSDPSAEGGVQAAAPNPLADPHTWKLNLKLLPFVGEEVALPSASLGVLPDQ